MNYLFVVFWYIFITSKSAVYKTWKKDVNVKEVYLLLYSIVQRILWRLPFDVFNEKLVILSPTQIAFVYYCWYMVYNDSDIHVVFYYVQWFVLAIQVCDSNFEVKCSNFKSRFTWNNYLALTNISFKLLVIFIIDFKRYSRIYCSMQGRCFICSNYYKNISLKIRITTFKNVY